MSRAHVLSEPCAREVRLMWAPLRGRRLTDIQAYDEDLATWNRLITYVRYLVEVGWSRSSIAEVMGMSNSYIWELMQKPYEPVDIDDLPDWQPETPENRGRQAGAARAD